MSDFFGKTSWWRRRDLADEVEERLEVIENSERELDQWCDQQLHKNRHLGMGFISFSSFFF